ncbi:hypothetical protein D3C80_516620 [compost metagenome]
MKYLARRVGVFTNLHLERYVPDVVQTKRHQRTFNHAVDTKCHYRVLVRSPLREGLDSRTDRRPDEGQHYAQNDCRQAGDNRHKALTGKEAQVFRQLNAEEAVKHIGRDGAGDNPPEHTGIRQVFGRDLFSWQVQHQRRYYCHGFHHDAVSHYCG